MAHFSRFLRISFALWMVICSQPVLAQTSESDLKAAFIFTLTKYVEWPVERLPEESPLRICFGENAINLTSAMQPLVGRLVRGHPLEIRVLPVGTAGGGCHVLVNPPLPVKGKSGVLVLSDREGALDQGGHVELSILNNRVHFETNLTAARQVDLQLSGQLLKLARTVK